LLGPHRLKPVVNIARELAAIRTLDPQPVLELADDNTFTNRADADELLEALARADARYFTEVDWRVGEHPDLVAKLAASGCVQVLVGIESLVFRYPGMGPKQAELPRIMAALEAIQAAGVSVIGCFIVGCDGETHDSLDRLAEFIQSSPLADVQLTLQTPFPGTALRRRLEREGRLLQDRGWSHCTLFDVVYRPDVMSVGELESAFRALARDVFGPSESARRRGIRKRVWQNNPRLRPCNSEPSPAT
jgi:radical SAM superfamily enzyme YgiQ (UPF0313 family)